MMTEEFKKRMSKAMENGILIAKKQDKEYLEKVEHNQKFADLYMDLVIALVEQFDFHSDRFKVEKLNPDFVELFGSPRNISAWVSDKDQSGTIALDYGDDRNPWGRVGEPVFKNDSKFDLEIINDILEENGISIREDSVDGGGYGTNCDYVSFDASMLIETRKNLVEESPIQFTK